MTNGNEPINVLRGADNRVFGKGDFDGWHESFNPIIGLTKREYFAAMAMQGYCANENTWQELTIEETVIQSVKISDLLINELNKPQSK